MDIASGQGGRAGIGSVLNLGVTGDAGPVLGNQLDNRGNRGVSDFDRTHRFVLSSVWDIPGSGVCRPSAIGRMLLSKWQLSGIITAMSGYRLISWIRQQDLSTGLAAETLGPPQFRPGYDV